MFDLFGNINKLRNIHSDSEKKKIAKLLQTTPEALEEFEKAFSQKRSAISKDVLVSPM